MSIIPQPPAESTQTASRICAIHQPNFFPWLGYFDKIQHADVFIFLDNVQMQKTGSNWTNRVKLNIQGQAAWVTCPILRESGTTLIRDIRIDDRQPWRKKLIKTLETNYRKAPCYEQAMEILQPLIHYETDSLSLFNMHTIRTLCPLLGIRTDHLKTQSELGILGSSTPLLIELVQAVGAQTYLCGGGAGGYQEDHLFSENGLALEYQAYQPVPYGPENSFLPGLSVIDYLMQAFPQN